LLAFAFGDFPASDAVDGPVDAIMSGIKESLFLLLKEASFLVSEVPCISPIVQMLLYAIQMGGVRVLSLF
jgi:hypothetical protein